MENSPKTITVEAAARELGIGRSLAYSLARTGELPGVIRLGSRRLRVSRAQLDAVLRGEDGTVPEREAAVAAGS